MTKHDFVKRFTVSQRHLSGAAAGVTVHRLRVPMPTGMRFSVAVVDGKRAWFIPAHNEDDSYAKAHEAANGVYAACQLVAA